MDAMRRVDGIARASGLLILLVPAVAMAGCIVSSGLEAMKDTPVGSLSLETVGGTRTITPNGCLSGERQMFLGGDFPSDGGLTVRLIVGPAGEASLRVFEAAHPLDRGRVFARGSCERFELSLDRTGWRINDIYDLSLHVAVDCRDASGERLAGNIRAAHCH